MNQRHGTVRPRLREPHGGERSTCRRGWHDRVRGIAAVLAWLCVSAGVAAADLVTRSTYGTPTIDGIVSAGEWDLSRGVTFDHGIIAFRHDVIRLYLLVDVVGDTGDDPPNWLAGDTIGITVDRDEDGAISTFDTRYRLFDDRYNLRYQHFVRPYLLAPREPLSRSSIAAGFDCFVADGTKRVDFPTYCYPHRVWEVAFDLDEIFAQPGATARLGLTLRSENPAIDASVPDADLLGDVGELIAVTLEDVADLPVASLDTSIAFAAAEGPPFEVSQAVQERDNGLPLVAGKDTVARAYVTIDSSAGGRQPLVTFLYGSRGDADLPGSPLAQLHSPPRVIDRARLGHTANFLLPRGWAEGTIVLQGRAVTYDTYANEAVSDPQPVSFTEKEEPIVWIVPINGGSDAEPQLPDPADVLAHREYLRATYPVPDVRFQTAHWTALGAFEAIDFRRYRRPLEGLWLGAFLGAALSGRWDLMPDQIFGFAPECDENGTGRCGVAYTGPGVVAIGADKGCTYATNLVDLVACDRAVMAHEIDHNLDRADPTTWGRHVTDPTTDPDAGIENDAWGCGAEFPDLAWAARWSDDQVREFGFDTRRPWEDAPVLLAPNRYNLFTVVPPEFPDFLSYCESSMRTGDPVIPRVSTNPTRWISAYRWLRLFCALPSPPGTVEPLLCASLQLGGPLPLAQRLRRGIEQTQPVFYVSGHVARAGAKLTGALRPVVAQPGAPDETLPPGDFSLELRDGNGNPLLTRSFAAPFVDSEGVRRDVAEFTLQLPAVPNATEIVLRHGPEPLDARQASAHAPQVTVLQPAAGAQWSAGLRHTIAWSAGDLDGDALAFSVLYTPDGGQTWQPVAWDVEGDSLAVDAAMLPGGADARIRVIASDGFHTSEADSAVFWVEGGAPDGGIVRPANGARFVAGAPIDFEAQGVDPEDGELPGDAFVWTVNGATVDAGRRVRAYLPTGTHRVVLTVTDADGKSALHAIAVAVLADADGDQVADADDNCRDVVNPDQTDADADGVGDACDRCRDTIIPEGVPTKRLLPNHFALVDGDTVFDTAARPPHKTSTGYTVADTHGCSCEQVIALFRLGAGERLFGCSLGTMERATRPLPPHHPPPRPRDCARRR